MVGTHASNGLEGRVGAHARASKRAQFNTITRERAHDYASACVSLLSVRFGNDPIITLGRESALGVVFPTSRAPPLLSPRCVSSTPCPCLVLPMICFLVAPLPEGAPMFRPAVAPSLSYSSAAAARPPPMVIPWLCRGVPRRCRPRARFALAVPRLSRAPVS